MQAKIMKQVINNTKQNKRTYLNWVLIFVGVLFILVYLLKYFLVPFEFENKSGFDYTIYDDETIFESVSKTSNKYNLWLNLGINKSNIEKYNQWICNSSKALSLNQLIFDKKEYKSCIKTELIPTKDLVLNPNKKYAILLPNNVEEPEISDYCVSVLTSKNITSKTIKPVITINSNYFINNPNYKNICLLQ
jgi:hypothetical protein